jgi:hypothetical protein
MRLFTQGTIILISGFAALMIAGCAEQQEPGDRKYRLISAENLTLKKDLQQRDKEIEKLKALNDRQSKSQAEALDDCMKQQEVLREKAKQNIRDQVKNVLDVVLEQNTKLRQENAALKAQIEQLENVKVESQK